jgi:two-component sensor histidine kinase/PAS domain-containing protein
MSDSAPDQLLPEASELLAVFAQLRVPVAFLDRHGIIRCASASWHVRAAELGLSLKEGMSLLQYAPLAKATHAVINDGQQSVTVDLLDVSMVTRLCLQPCRYGGGVGALVEFEGAAPALSNAPDLVSITNELRERELQFAAIAANLPGILYRVVRSDDGTIDFPYISTNTSAVVGRAASAHWLDRIHPADREEFFEVLRNSADQLLPFDLEQRVVGVPDQEIWVRNITRPHRRADGAVIWDGMILDITAQKQVEQDLQRSLRDKDALLQEVHHRVKNNLQIISSLLDLQAITISDPQAQAAFTESQRRIQAMALVHEQLYHVETMSHIDFGAYVRTLTDYLQQSFVPQAHTIAVVIEIVDIWLDAHAAIPCGLIINELVANAFKHAFPDQRVGEIRITCQARNDGTLELAVADTGIGLPPVPGQQRPGSLGLRLVSTLTKQLRGTLRMENDQGALVTVTFEPGRNQQNL